MIKTFITATSLGAVLLFGVPATSEAATIGIAPTGVTSVTVTANLGALGLGGVPDGSATNMGATFFFPITGGTIDTTSDNALIEHEGSGVTLFTTDTENDQSVTVGNFLINTLAGTVSGDVLGGASGVTFFTLGTAGVGGIPLLISPQLASAIQATFTGAPDLKDVQFGLASMSPTPVPVPAALPLLLAGVGGLALMRRKRAA